jgi:hypothetical protein
LDRRALEALDGDFKIGANGERAVISGEMEIEIIRPDADRLELTIRFPGDERFLIRLLRTQLLHELGVTES